MDYPFESVEIRACITALREGSRAEKRNAMRSLAECAFVPESRAAVAALRRELGGPDQLLQIAAAEALACIGEAVDEAAQVLEDALAAPDRMVRLAAIESFGFAGAVLRPWTTALAPVIDSEDVTTGRAAIEAVRLAGTTSEDVVNRLVGCLSHQALGAAALQALIAVRSRPGLLAALERCTGRLPRLALEGLVEQGPLGKDLIAVMARFETSSLRWRRKDPKLLAALVDGASVAIIAEALDSADEKTGLALINFLSIVAVRYAVPNGRTLVGPLLRFLRRTGPEGFRRLNTRILESALEATGPEELVALTGDDLPELRRLGYAALARHAERFTAELIRGLDDADYRVRAAALTSLSATGETARPYLLARLADPEFRSAALEMLVLIAPEAPETMSALREEIPRGFLGGFTLKRLRKLAKGPLAELLSDELLKAAHRDREEERCRAVVRLGALPSPVVLRALEDWLSDESPARRAGAEQALAIAAEEAPAAVRASGIFDRCPVSPVLAYACWLVTGRVDKALRVLLRSAPLLDLKYDEVSGGFRLTVVPDYAPLAVGQLAVIIAGSAAARHEVEQAAGSGDIYVRLCALRGLAAAGVSLPSERIADLGSVLDWAAGRGRRDPFTGDTPDFSWRVIDFDGMERLWIEASAVAGSLLAESGRACEVLDSLRALIDHREGQSHYFREGDALRWHGLQLAAIAGPKAAALVPSVVELLDDDEVRCAAITTLVAILPELSSFEQGLRAALDVGYVRSRLLPLLRDSERLVPAARFLKRFQIQNS